MASSSFYNTENPTPAEIETAQSLLDQANTVSQAVVDAGNTASTAATNAANSATSASTSATSATGSATTATTKASEASTSATNAASSASAASTSATNAASSATTATTKATEAASSATSAASSASSASTSATNAASSASSAATSASNAASTLASALVKTNNLSDLSNAVTARSNLGLGTVAIESTVPVAKGGTGLTTLTAGYIPFGNGTGALGSNSVLNWDNALQRLYAPNVSINNSINWNFSSLNLTRTASNTGNPRLISMMLDGDSTSSTTIGAYNAIWGAYDSAPTTGSTSSALNGAMVYGAYAGHRWYNNGSERMRIDSTGAVGIGTPSLTGWCLRSDKDITGSTASIGIGVTGIVQSDVTADAKYFRTNARTASASFTLPTLQHYYASQGTIGSGSAVTNQFGFYAEATLTGATNNYGFYSNIASGTGRWNFYAAGTADNYFAGNVAIGNVASSSQNLLISGNVTSGPVSVWVQNLATTSGVADLIAYHGSGAQLTTRAGNGYTAFISTGTGVSQLFSVGGTERMRIDSSGRVGIGATPGVSSNFVVATNVTGATTANLTQFQAVVQSDVTSNAYGMRVALGTQDAAFTLTNLYHYSVAPSFTIGASSTVTNQYGFAVQSNLTGATNNYGFYSNIASGTGRWNFYAAGTANNYFAGNVYIGSNTAQLPSGLTGADLQISTLGSTQASVALSQWSATGTASAQISLARSAGGARGTYLAATAGLLLAKVRAFGSDGAGFFEAASIDYYADAAASTGSVPGRIVFSTTASGGSSPTERLRIDSSGNVGIGIAPTKRLQVKAPDSNAIVLVSGDTMGFRIGMTSAGSIFEGVDYTGAASYQPLYIGGSTLTFQISGSTKYAITSSGNYGFGTTAFGTSAVGVIGIANGTAPTTSPAGMGQLYVEAGALKYRGSSGTVTTIAAA